MLIRLKEKKRKDRMRELESFLSKAGFAGYDYGGEPLPAGMADSEIRYSLNELTHLRQQPIIDAATRYGIDISDDSYWDSAYPPLFAVLNKVSTARLRREITAMRRANIEFWAKIVLPIISIIVSIGTLILALKKK